MTKLRGLKPSDIAITLACATILALFVQSQRRLGALELAVRSVPERPVAVPQADTAEVTANDGIVIGASTAPITIVQFTDYECPFCRRFQDETLPLLMNRYIDQGQVKLLVRDLPLSIHPNARFYASAAKCAAGQNVQILPFLAELYSGAAAKADPDSVVGRASDAVGLKSDLVLACVRSDRFGKAVQADASEAELAGLRGTPAFVIGKSGTMVRGTVIRGAMPVAVFESAIDHLVEELDNADR